VVEKKGLPNAVKIGIAAALLLIAAIVFYLNAPTGQSQTIAADRITVSTVERGRFDDFLPLRARVEPLVTVFLDAVEGGRVEKVLVEDGALVQQGQLLAVLSNSDSAQPPGASERRIAGSELDAQPGAGARADAHQ
jgi:HlyD family secretion protein